MLRVELHLMGRSILSFRYRELPLVELLFSCFDYTEIDSSFYKTPSLQMVKNWAMKTPKNFKFTAKFPKAITHDKRLLNVDKELEHFFEKARKDLEIPDNFDVMAMIAIGKRGPRNQLPPQLQEREYPNDRKP